MSQQTKPQQLTAEQVKSLQTKTINKVLGQETIKKNEKDTNTNIRQ